MPKTKIKPNMGQEPVILASKRDKEIFFNAISDPLKPGNRLVKAAKRYQQLYSHPAIS